MSATATARIIGTGAGTGIKAATDIAKESGLTDAGGYPLISDWTDSRYIGHGVGHRDPKTGEPIPSHIHIPADGELNPQNYVNVAAADEDPEVARQRTRDAFLEKYNEKKASAYRANCYQLLGSIQSKFGNKEKAEINKERAKLEHAAYNVDHSEIHFRGEKRHKK